MNIAIWILAGAALGWAAFALLRLNEERGTIASMIIGAFGGIIGGHMIAPMMTSVALVPGNFSMQALFVAAVAATACLAIGNLIERRFHV
jgi:uncharacterized membrane protein YeaQ/YmgE (transglycosylase-associated protein family)